MREKTHEKVQKPGCFYIYLCTGLMPLMFSTKLYCGLNLQAILAVNQNDRGAGGEARSRMCFIPVASLALTGKAGEGAMITKGELKQDNKRSIKARIT